MLVLRLVAALAVVLIGGSVIAYLATRDRRYLTIAWRCIRYFTIFALVVFALFFLERIAIVV